MALTDEEKERYALYGYATMTRRTLMLECVGKPGTVVAGQRVVFMCAVQESPDELDKKPDDSKTAVAPIAMLIDPAIVALYAPVEDEDEVEPPAIGSTLGRA